MWPSPPSRRTSTRSSPRILLTEPTSPVCRNFTRLPMVYSMMTEGLNFLAGKVAMWMKNRSFVRITLRAQNPTSFTKMKWKIAQYLERRWWKHYLRQKDAAEYLTDKRQYWQRTLNQLGHSAKAGNASLDAGCGPAGIFILLHDQERVTALDPLLERYATDLDIFSFSGYPKVDFITSPLETASLPAAGFETIYCFNAINHVRDWELALDRLTEWAAPGATMLISSDVHRRPWLKRIFRLLPGDLLHPQQHDAEAYHNALVKRDWRIDEKVILREELIFNYVGWRVVKVGPK
ncbi:hypothetical protein CEQ90_04710 [Lewinellaceae bacterium SD302]|nr:hypothetical protein CEQ90_04710 [Lewinellaceae bacterium SD302]